MIDKIQNLFDSRDLETTRQQTLDCLNDRCGWFIDEVMGVKPYKQLNMANGILEAEEAETYKTVIVVSRNVCQYLKDKVKVAKCPQDIDGNFWPPHWLVEEFIANYPEPFADKLETFLLNPVEKGPIPPPTFFQKVAQFFN